MAPYYFIQDSSDTKSSPIPVKAKNAPQALAAIVQPRFTVRLAETEELLACAEKGIRVIDATVNGDAGK